MKSQYLLIVAIGILNQITSIFANENATHHDEDDNSDLVFLGVFILLIILAFVISSYYGKRTKENLYGKSND